MLTNIKILLPERIEALGAGNALAHQSALGVAQAFIKKTPSLKNAAAATAFRRGTLYLEAKNAAYAAQAYLFIDVLKQRVQAQCPDARLTRITIRIAPQKAGK